MKQTVSDAPLLHTLVSAAKRLGVSRDSIYRLVNSGSLGYVRLHGGDRRVPETELIDWIVRNTVKATER